MKIIAKLYCEICRTRLRVEGVAGRTPILVIHPLDALKKSPFSSRCPYNGKAFKVLATPIEVREEVKNHAPVVL